MKISLRIKMLIMSFAIVFISVVTSGWIMIHNITLAFESEIGQRAMAIARTVAQMPDIQKYVGTKGGEHVIQPIAERTKEATNTDYIVILDMNRIRYSHPNENLLGEIFVGGDEYDALHKKEYVSQAEGTLGNALRAFVPIIDEVTNEQIGVAVVGILMPTFQSLTNKYSNDMTFSLIWGLLIGLFGSYLLAHNIKKQTFGLEPYEIAKLVEERSAVMQAMNTGMIAIDDHGTITFINNMAKNFTENRDMKKTHIKDLIPILWEPIVHQLHDHKEPFINHNVLIYEKTYLVSLYNIHVKGKRVGILITMVDRTEATQLAEELTGVKLVVDALRSQNHEYMNKLHSIAGLIQLERNEEALEVIMTETDNEEKMIELLKERLKDYSVAGLLIGKSSRARELKIDFSIDRDSYLESIIDGISSGDLITVIGNLIENAFESFPPERKHKVVECHIQGNDQHLFIKVSDNGSGISPSDIKNIFSYGFSTKQKEGHGIGLTLVHQIVTSQNGKIDVQSEVGEGTEITIELNRGMGKS